MQPRREAAALDPVILALESLGVEHYIGGSIASSVHGVVRTTIDVDVVADLKLEHVPAFIAHLGTDFYADARVMQDAIRTRSSFNLIHIPTSYKVDLFIMKRTRFEDSARTRIIEEQVFPETQRRYRLASPEDVVLNKLEWFRRGGEVSERQWSDVIGVMRVQANALDRQYMQRWAAELNVSDLLERALKEAGLAH
jgi:hypothetical protein